ncbi:carbohydrate-binding module family 50 protein [Auriscalpium vulgare]|uniref:Carbohydrate-binding module family 50 protein n=1 Tax=Auriscalpium vulgare TaxID=40419 RepID=A0ACB8S1E4_9AGAM|nr:carbohydrate-binding module family 50 protein [Auriscalpium vulgare]
MPSKDGLSASPTAYDESWDDHGLYSNPFNNEVADKPFTSALDVSSRRTVMRRRGSDSAVSTKSLGEASPRSPKTAHSRSRTVDDAPESVHPLRRSSSAKSWRSDAGNTRPHLSRMVSSRRSSSQSPEDTKFEDDPAEQGGEKDVVIHEVARHDSLAGVALKYGIAIADLRRANSLWASDSIHLRNHLYIPVDKARHARRALAQPLQESTITATPAAERASAPPDSAPTTYFVHKVPATRLSYFPPSSSSPQLPSFTAPDSPIRTRTAPSSPANLSDILSPDYFTPPATIAARPSHTTSSSNLRNHTLATIFSVLPIPASTREDIISRFSVESTSSSVTGSDDQEHEMRTVPTTPKSRVKLSSPIPFLSPRKSTPNPKHASPPSFLSRTPSNGKGKGSRPPDVVEHIALGSSPIRTVQMEPAPVMRLPEQMVRTASKTGSDADTSAPYLGPSRSRTQIR